MFENSEKTNIESLGEFGLIDHLTKQIKIKQKSTLKGIGDDAAVIDFEGEKGIGINRYAVGRYTF